MNQPEQSNNKKTITIIVTVVAAVGFLSLLCCGGLAYFGYTKVSDMETTYHAECEDLIDSDACSECCNRKGHNGHTYGSLFNEEGKNCGCL